MVYISIEVFCINLFNFNRWLFSCCPVSTQHRWNRLHQCLICGREFTYLHTNDLQYSIVWHWCWWLYMQHTYSDGKVNHSESTCVMIQGKMGNLLTVTEAQWEAKMKIRQQSLEISSKFPGWNSFLWLLHLSLLDGCWGDHWLPQIYRPLTMEHHTIIGHWYFPVITEISLFTLVEPILGVMCNCKMDTRHDHKYYSTIL